jgi:methionine--tRNA ligase beta chain
MAKDNIPFHTVIFPASLIGTGKKWTLLHHINAIEYLNYENTKFSKSRNVGVFGNDVKETGIHIDLWRFYLLANRPEKNDSQFTWDDFIEKVNSEFTDNIGNMVNRTLVYLKKNFDGKIRDLDLPEPHRLFIEECKKEFEQVTEAYESVRLRDAIRAILAIGNRGNKFFQYMQPWEQIKTEPEKAHARDSVLAYLVKSVAIALYPIMPETANGILEIMNIKEYSWKDIGQFTGLDGHKVNQPSIVHKKLDLKLAEKFRKQFSGKQSDFGRIELKIGKIEEVKKHPNADQLYWLSVDLGEKAPRSIVAGLVKSYTPEELQGRKVIVLSNLKPAKLRDIKSEGMILVCKHRNKMELLDGTPFEPGDIITVDGENVDHSEITMEEFNNIDLLVKEGFLMSGGQKCHINGVPVETHELKTERYAETIRREKFIRLSSVRQHEYLALLARKALESRDFKGFIKRYNEMQSWVELDKYVPPYYLTEEEAIHEYLLFHKGFSANPGVINIKEVEPALIEPLSWSPKYDVTIVLDQVRSPYNTGSVLRLIDNFGFRRLVHNAAWLRLNHPQLCRAARGSQNWIPVEYRPDLAEWIGNLDIPGIGIENSGDAILMDEWRPVTPCVIILVMRFTG